MIQINNGFLPCYCLDEQARVFDTDNECYLKEYGAGHNYYMLQTTTGSKRKISKNSLYLLVYGKVFAEDNIPNLPNEEWREIENTEGQYFVSNKGRVKSYAGIKAKLLKPNNLHGYYRVDIMYNKQRCSELVHRLVAQYFLPLPPNIGYELHHKDFNSLNNSADNLEWLSKQDHVKIHSNHNKKNMDKAEKNECS